MKRTIALILSLVAFPIFAADVYHQGYMRSDGTYVQPYVGANGYQQGYMRSDGTYVQPYYQPVPDRTPYNNYNTQGNVNPYSGQQGTVQPYQPVQPAQPYQPAQPAQPMR